MRTVSHAYVFDLPIESKTHINPHSNAETRIALQAFVHSDKLFISHYKLVIYKTNQETKTYFRVTKRDAKIFNVIRTKLLLN